MSFNAPTPHIIIMGNPVDGFRYIGPFDCIEDARLYIETEAASDATYDGPNMWIAELDLPSTQDKDYDDNGNLLAGCSHNE